MFWLFVKSSMFGNGGGIVRKRAFYYLAVGTLVFTAGCSRVGNSRVSGTPVADEMVAWLKEQQTADVKAALDEISNVESSRNQAVQDSIEAAEEESRSAEEAVKESIKESGSIEESIRESIWKSEEESRYVEASIAYSIAAAEAESRYIEASLAEESEALAQAQSLAASLAESSAEASSIAESIAESRSVEASIAESRSIEASLEESSLEELRRQIEEAGGDYLLQLCAGTHLTPYGVATIDDSDARLVYKLFEHTAVIGDSRVEGVAWVLDGSEVFFSRGAYAGKLYDIARQAAAMYPEKALFWIGLNDMSVYEANVDAFVKDYKAVIKDFLSINPGCKIYIHNQPSIPQEGLENFEYAKYIDQYNDAMAQMCKENGWTYVDGSAYLRAEYFAADGLHFQKAFYRYWAQDMANQLDLWGDLAQ